MVRLARMGVVLALLAACGGGSDGDSASPTDAAESTTTTTAAPTTEIDIRQPIPAGSLYDTPRPPLKNKGDDYVAIFESLEANFRWLTENPDPGLVYELFVAGSEVAGVQGDVIAELASNQWRAADDGYRLVDVTVTSTSPESVTLQVTDQVDFEQIVDSDGERVGEGVAHGDPQSYTVILARDSEGQWRIADAVVTDDSTVEL